MIKLAKFLASWMVNKRSFFSEIRSFCPWMYIIKIGAPVINQMTVIDINEQSCYSNDGYCHVAIETLFLSNQLQAVSSFCRCKNYQITEENCIASHLPKYCSSSDSSCRMQVTAKKVWKIVRQVEWRTVHVSVCGSFPPYVQIENLRKRPNKKRTNCWDHGEGFEQKKKHFQETAGILSIAAKSWDFWGNISRNSYLQVQRRQILKR